MDNFSAPSYHDVKVTYTAPKASTSSEAIVHYIEAGDSNNPTILLLHGLPASSFMYRDLIPMLSDSYHLLAPDYPGFGLTKVADDFEFSFENIAVVMAAWLETLKIKEAAMYIQDYGAPVGLRLAITNGIKPTAIISQNGNAYKDGLGEEFWRPVYQLWKTGSDQARKMIADNVFTYEGTKEHFTMGAPEKDLHLIDPQTWTLSYLQNIAGPVQTSRQLDLIYDYHNNFELYPAFQKYFRDSKVPILAVWGKGDPAFIPAGAEAFRKDCPDAVVHLIDAGHFALETARWEIVRIMKDFLIKVGYQK